jgi:hypothetical protein
MWVKTANMGLLNLEHAISAEYNEAKTELKVWWSFTLPSSDNERREIAELHDTTRLAYYHVKPNDWLAVLAQALPVG